VKKTATSRLKLFSYVILLIAIAPVRAACLRSTLEAPGTFDLQIAETNFATTLLLAKGDQPSETKSESLDASIDGASSKTSSKSGANDKKPYLEEAIKHYNRGVELHQSGFLNQAITEYKGAIEADPRMEEAYSNLGVIYAAQRNYPRAKEAFSTALSLKPKRPTTLNGLGTVLYAQGHVKEAKDKWMQALAVDPKFASAYYNIGNACESEKSFGEALGIYAQAIAVAPSMADAYYRIGAIYYRQHHLPQASVMLRRAIELAPDGDFANDAKRIQRNLEEDFSKHESAGRGIESSRHETAKGAEGDEPKNKQLGKKKKTGLDMFVQPAEEQVKSGGGNSGQSSL
jgi:tetratricopeptide (TPR) repeat protein